MKKITVALSVLSILLMGAVKTHAQDELVISVHSAPPEMPYYEQPPCPAQGYIWTPGYWAYGACQGGYYWVPGVWVAAPQPNYYWTPSWWGYENGYYGYHPGYWGTEVGYYGGINYGYGYGGDGYYGGRWRGNNFEYNTAACNVNTTVVRNTYVDNSYANNTVNTSRASYNGPGGYTRQPTPREVEVAKSPTIIRPTTEQQTHQKSAGDDVTQYSTPTNHGHPSTVSMDKINGQKFAEKPLPQSKPEPVRTTPTMENHPVATPAETTGKPQPANPNEVPQPNKVPQPEQKPNPAEANQPNKMPQQQIEQKPSTNETNQANKMPQQPNNTNQPQQHPAQQVNNAPPQNHANPQSNGNPSHQQQNNRQPKNNPPPRKNTQPKNTKPQDQNKNSATTQGR
ncbi:MAG TPA: hypothetical protein VK808_12840 [Bacteroidia bacterium]|jgi:hypothetical protein|nr:hypothetical protein [Bacteroidia bacterium]